MLLLEPAGVEPQSSHVLEKTQRLIGAGGTLPFASYLVTGQPVQEGGFLKSFRDSRQILDSRTSVYLLKRLSHESIV